MLNSLANLLFMSKTIVQKIIFKKASVAILYNLYMNSRQHAAATQADANISPIEGGRYSAHDKYITGNNLRLVKNKLIVQSWRASNWGKDIADSIFIIALEQKGNDVIVVATHANVPDDEFDDLKKGWKEFYWEPWKKYLAGPGRTRSSKS